MDPSKLSMMKDVVTFVEEGFSIVEVVDVTTMLQSKGYVGSYNVPYTKKIYNKLGYEKCTFPITQIHILMRMIQELTNFLNTIN